MLETLRDYGLCRIEGVPPQPDRSDEVIRLVGPQRATNFGTYTLTGKNQIDNVGDTTDALDPHNDETYRLSTIGITVFQVLRPRSSGGASTLVDGFEAMRRLRQRWPEDFDLLTRLPVTSHRIDRARNGQGYPGWYVSRMPVIKLDDDGAISGVRLNERQIAPLDLPYEQDCAVLSRPEACL